MKPRMHAAVTMLCLVCGLPSLASADPWEVRREWREGARNVQQERREAAREIRRCASRECVEREVREGRREVGRERREARHEVRREWYEDGRHRDARRFVHYHDGYYRGGQRWYREGRYWHEPEYVHHYYHGGRGHDHDDDFVKGLVIGAAAVGVIAAIHEANED